MLYYLRQEEHPVELTTLAEHVAAWENQTDVDSLEDQQRKRVYVSLYQTHVPKLDDAGVVEYDEEEGTVRLAEGARSVDEYLSQPEDDVPWQTIYVTEAILGAVLLALTTYDLVGFGAIPDAAVSLLILLVFAGTAVVHAFRRRQRDEVPSELRRR